jgi:hypothetical protein
LPLGSATFAQGNQEELRQEMNVDLEREAHGNLATARPLRLRQLAELGRIRP